MLRLGDLVVFLRGNSQDLDKSLQNAESRSRSVAGNISGFFQNAFSFVTGNIVTGALTKITAAIGSIKDAMIGGNTAFEQYRTQFSVLLGNADLARERLQELAEFGQKTPFELPDLVQADRILQSFGLHAPDVTERWRQMGVDIKTITGDMAAGTGASFQEIATNIGRFSAGATGEALQRFAELGIVTRSELAAVGVEFSKSGELVSPMNEALDALLQLAQQKFGGMMEAQSQTLGGMISNFWDWVNNAGRILGEPIFDKLKDGLEAFLKLVEPGSPVNQAVEALAGTIRAALDVAQTLLETMVGGGLGSAVENWATNLTEKLQGATAFLKQLKDEILGLTAGDILGQLGPGLQDLQDKMNKSLDDLSKRHEQTVAGIQSQLTGAAEKLGKDLAEINEKYADKISDLQKRIADTAEGFQERLHDLAEQSAKRRKKLEDQIAKATAGQEERLTELKRDHMRRRQELATSLMTAESEEQYLNIKAQMEAEDEKYNEQVNKTKDANKDQLSELQARLKEEEAEYYKQYTRLNKQRDKSLADLTEQLNKVQAEKDKEVAEVQKAYDQEVAALNAKLDAENAAYAENQQKIKDMYAQQMADFEADINARAAAIGQGPAAELVALVKGWIAKFNEFKESAGAAWTEVKRIIDIFREQGFGAGVSALAELVTQKLNEISLAIDTWVNDPANQEKFNAWGQRAGQALVDGIVYILTGEGGEGGGIAMALLTALGNLKTTIDEATFTLAFQFVTGFVIAVTTPENIEQLKNSVASALTQASDWWAKTLADWAGGISEWWAKTLADWADSITGFDWGQVGEDVVGGLMGGLQSKWDELTAWLSEKAAELPDWATDPLGIHSDSTVFARRVGQWIPGGIRKGFEAGLPDLRQAIAQGMQSLVPPQPAAGSLAGVGATNYVNLAPRFDLGQAPANFDAAGLLGQIDERMIALLDKFYSGE